MKSQKIDYNIIFNNEGIIKTLKEGEEEFDDKIKLYKDEINDKKCLFYINQIKYLFPSVDFRDEKFSRLVYNKLSKKIRGDIKREKVKDVIKEESEESEEDEKLNEVVDLIDQDLKDTNENIKEIIDRAEDLYLSKNKEVPKRSLKKKIKNLKEYIIKCVGNLNEETV